MMRTLPCLPLVLAALGCPALGCRSTDALERHQLPMHVAVVPITTPAVGHAASGEHPGKATALSLALDTREVTRAMSAALEEYCFASVTVLDADLPDETRTDEFERQRSLYAQARELGADLMVELGLRYDAEIYRQAASTFWLNFPLFLFLAPSNWFLPDNTYCADVELVATVYDLNAMEAGGFGLGDAAAQVVSVSARFGETTLDFIERSRGLGDYALGILVPSGFLARETRGASAEIHAAILESLRTQLVQSLQNRRADLVRADWIAPVFMEPTDVSIRREGADLRVRGRVRLARGGLADRVHAIHLDAGAEHVSVEPARETVAGGAGEDVFDFEASVPLGAEASFLRLECEAGSRDRFLRSYTFRIPAP